VTDEQLNARFDEIAKQMRDMEERIVEKMMEKMREIESELLKEMIP